MKIVALSDTHNYHRELKIPDGDLIIHAGDATLEGKENELYDFACWFSDLPHKYKIFVAGNHDIGLQEFPKEKKQALLTQFIDSNIIYLEDAACKVGKLRIYGTPWTTMFMDWAFMKDESHLVGVYNKIPNELDILISHGPPQGILDRVGYRVLGSTALEKRLTEIKTRVHIFGHIHGGYGYKRVKETDHYNVAVCDEAYSPSNRITEIEL